MKFITWTNECVSILLVVCARPDPKPYSFDLFLSICAAIQYLLNPFTLPPPPLPVPPLPLFFSVPCSFKHILLLYLFRFEDVSNFSSSYNGLAMCMCASACLILSGFCEKKRLSFIVTRNMIACKEKDKRMCWVTAPHNSSSSKKSRRRDSKTNKHRVQCNWK